MSAEEIRLAKTWAIHDNMSASAIAERLGRNKSTITRLLKLRSSRKGRGRKVFDAVLLQVTCATEPHHQAKIWHRGSPASVRPGLFLPGVWPGPP